MLAGSERPNMMTTSMRLDKLWAPIPIPVSRNQSVEGRTMMAILESIAFIMISTRRPRMGFVL